MHTTRSHPVHRAPAASSSTQRAQRLLARADVRINGSRPWDIQVHHPRLFRRTFASGTLGFGEAYMDGWWDCERLDEFAARVHQARITEELRTPTLVWEHLKARLINLQKPSRAFEIARRHYDLGNDLFERMLDSRLCYSCGYWRDASDLESAQRAKLDLIAEKLGFREGMRVLDIGCGWGGSARYLAEAYGVSVLGITVSQEQAKHAAELCRDRPVEIRVQDYRELRGRFDRIYSVGMFEHVGERNYRTYLDTVRRLLTRDGLFLLHTIGGASSTCTTDPWIQRYIFPNSMLPSAAQITDAAEGLFVIEDWHNFGADYDRTLMAWYANFEAAWTQLARQYDERFRRMWRFYLLTCAGSFRARHNQLWQIVLSPTGVPGGYRSVR